MRLLTPPQVAQQQRPQRTKALALLGCAVLIFVSVLYFMVWTGEETTMNDLQLQVESEEEQALEGNIAFFPGQQPIVVERPVVDTNRANDGQDQARRLGKPQNVVGQKDPRNLGKEHAAWGISRQLMASRGELRGKQTSKQLHGDQIGMLADGVTPGWKEHPYKSASEETEAEKKLAHIGNNFNLRRTNSLSLNRDIPDVRTPECQAQDARWKSAEFLASAPDTSIIFIFFNEPASTLYRSIHSVLNRSPPELLHEIILVDDGSDAAWLGKALDDYVALLPKTKLIRLEFRHGLMMARIKGAEAATGQTITFLDSHVEANDGWLEPLMARIAEDRRHVVMPVIDSIDADDFSISPGGIDILGHTWGLAQRGVSRKRIPGSTDAMPSPIMAGGLFSMDRKLFFELGAYDREMKQYGGEETDIAFRIWLCGNNSLECMPCSHVGHIFRSSKYWRGRAYPVDGSAVGRNKARSAIVWMDKYADIYFRYSHRPADVGPLEDLFKLKQKLECKPFKWYLDNVFPELFDPWDPQRYFEHGQIQSQISRKCIVPDAGTWNDNTLISLDTCGDPRSHKHPGFFFTIAHEVRADGHNYQFCWDAANREDGRIVFWNCHSGGGNQYFTRTANGMIKHHNRCLTDIDGVPVLRPCDDNDPGQRWAVLPYDS